MFLIPQPVLVEQIVPSFNHINHTYKNTLYNSLNLVHCHRVEGVKTADSILKSNGICLVQLRQFSQADLARTEALKLLNTSIMAEESALDTPNGWLPMTVEIQQCSEAECCA